MSGILAVSFSFIYVIAAIAGADEYESRYDQVNLFERGRSVRYLSARGIPVILAFENKTAYATDFDELLDSFAEKKGYLGIYMIEGQTVEVLPTNVFFNKYLLIKPCVRSCSERNDSMTPAVFDHKLLLADVNTLQVHDIIWPPLPQGDYLNDLGNIQFYNATPRGGFGACPKLRFLEIYYSDLSMTSSDWLVNCTKLIYLQVSGGNIMQIRTAIRSAFQLQNYAMVDLQNLEEWAYSVRDPIFSESSSLIKVSIESTASLEQKNTTWAEVSAAILWQISLLPRLQELKITLGGFDMCASGFTPVTLRSLRSLELYNDTTTSVCFRHYRKLPQLKKLTFSCSKWPVCRSIDIKFKVVEIFSSPGQSLDVIVNNRNITFNFELSREDYLMLSSEPTKKVVYFKLMLGLAVDCDCRDMFWLARAIKMGYVTASELKCRNGMSFKEFFCDRMECESVQCNSECICCRVGPHEEFIADCRGLKLVHLPIELLGLPNLTELYAPNNNISSLPKTLPNTLRLVDVSGNKIRNIHEELLANKSQHWRLAGNPLICACDNYPLLDTLEHQKNQIEDLENAKCVNKTVVRSLESLPDVCRSLELNKTLAKEKERKNIEVKLAKDREETLVISVSVVTVAAVVASAIGLSFYYRRAIQILLFARGWCLCWLEDEASDEDRRYDVFLSFCHADAELVLDELLPTLDQEYSVCVHLRDWMPGEMIPTQIRKSVEDSRRTLIFLTKNFAESLWGLLEFQTAYASGLEERRIRVVMVVVDDVLELPDLNKDLREYVRFNTYVQWGDPWFWSKLRYALPHRTTPLETPYPRPARYMAPALADAPPQALQIEAAPPHISLPESLAELGNSLPQEIQEASPSHLSKDEIPPESNSVRVAEPIIIVDNLPPKSRSLEIPPSHHTSPEEVLSEV